MQHRSKHLERTSSGDFSRCALTAHSEDDADFCRNCQAIRILMNEEMLIGPFSSPKLHERISGEYFGS